MAGQQGPAAAGHDRLRAGHGDREQVIETLKDAFADGRLARDEFDARVGRALAARTYADLAALTADIPAAARLPGPPVSDSPVPGRRPLARAAVIGRCAQPLVHSATFMTFAPAAWPDPRGWARDARGGCGGGSRVYAAPILSRPEVPAPARPGS
jgi:uncharacterized protein DUF1707